MGDERVGPMGRDDTGGLAALYTDSVLLAAEAGEQFFRTVFSGATQWAFEVESDPARFVFTGTEFPKWTAHLLGTRTGVKGPWNWAWENRNGFGAHVYALSESVREYGQRMGIAGLTTPEVPWHPYVAGFGVDDDALFAGAAMALTGLSIHHTVNAAGVRVHLLLENPEFRLPPVDEMLIADLAHHVTTTMVRTFVPDHRRAIESYGGLRGFPVTHCAGGLRAHGIDGHADFSFDEHGRLAGTLLKINVDGQDRISRG